VHRLRDILKTNDLRGAVPGQWGPGEAAALGTSLGRTFKDAEAFIVGHDMRLSGPALAEALTAGLTEAGLDVIFLGQVSTDMLYYASGSLNLPGAILTASHNPAGDNGLKLVRPGAKPVGAAAGLAEIVDWADANRRAPAAETPGQVRHLDLLRDFAVYLRELVDLTQIRPLKVAIDAGNGMGGVLSDAVLGTTAGLRELPLELVRLYFEPNGAFPNHQPDPLNPANLQELCATVVRAGADIGLAFDGDADRCFMVDQTGRPVPASVIGTLIAMREVAREQASGRGGVVVHNAITSRVLPELVAAAGAEPIRTRVGHSVIKPAMAEHDAVFGAEHSGHFYFRDFYYADSGILGAMHVLAALGSQPLPLSELAEMYSPYSSSGEINFEVADPVAAVQKVQMAYAADAARGVVSLDSLDGLTVSHWGATPRWWANVRPSNTEAMLRLNVEAEDADVMEKVRDGIAGIVGQGV
jgi:phosphomannomutase